MRFFFIAPDINLPVGGIKVMYENSSQINQLGHESYIVHNSENFINRYFDSKNINFAYTRLNRAKKITLKLKLNHITTLYTPGNNKIMLTDDDVIIIPEILAKSFGIYFSKQRKIIYCQAIPRKQHTPDTLISGLSHIEAIWVVSEDSKDYINTFYPHLKCQRLINPIDISNLCFSYPKETTICYLTKKNHSDVIKTIKALKRTKEANEFEFQPIHNMHYDDVVKTFKRSLFFINFSTFEGFGLPPVEAMSTGCIPIGYTGLGGNEFFLPDITFPTCSDDINCLYKTTLQAIRTFKSNKPLIEDMAGACSTYVANNYSPEKSMGNLKLCISKFE